MRPLAVLLAEGFEEVEAVTPIDFLRRAGIEVITAGVAGRNVTGSHGISLVADTTVGDLSPLDLDGVILPGGMPGSVNLHASDKVSTLVRQVHENGRLVAAICAAPARVLAPLGLLSGRSATCAPGEEAAFGKDVRFSEERVVRDGEVITSRGAGTAAEFAEEIIRYFKGPEKAQEIHVRTVQKD